MAESSKRGRKRGTLPIEPIAFLEMSKDFKEKIQEKEAQLRTAGLWDFLTDVEIPWPWPADLSEFVLSACASEFRQILVRGQPVRFDTEAIAGVTTLPGTDSVPVAEACRTINAPEWEVVFVNGQLDFNVKRQGWDLLKALPPWRDWLLLIQQRIELGRHGGFMEHCVVCAALAAWIRGTKFNWAEEVRSRIREEVENFRSLKPIPLRSAGYIGMLCQLSFESDTTSASRRSVTPFLSKPEGFKKEAPLPQAYNPPLSPEPPVILEEVIELHGDRPSERGVEPLCLPWNEASSPSRSPGYSLAVEREWREKMARVLGELEVQKRVIEKQQVEITLAQEEVTKEKAEKSRVIETVQKLSENLNRSRSEKEEWQRKSEEAEFLVGQISREKDQLQGEVTGLTREKSEWQKLKERQEQAIATKTDKVRSLEAQVRAFMIEKDVVLNLRQQLHSLQSLGEARGAVIDSCRGKIERLKAGIWAIENICPPFKSLFKNYELQRDVFFLVYDLKPSQVLDASDFERLWEEVSNDGYDHLLTEILVRGEVKLKDVFKGFQLIADLGVHIFLYYGQLELSLSAKRQLVSRIEAKPPNRQVELQQWSEAVNTTLAICPPLLLQPWHAEVARLRSSMGNDTFLQTIMDAASERVAIGKHLDVGAGQYQLKFDQINERLSRSLQTMAQSGRPVQVQLQNQVTFFLPPANLVQRALQSTRRSPTLPLQHQYLGNYSSLFDFDMEEPIPSWKAFDWIFEDVGLSRQISTRPEDAHDVVYRRICHGWSLTPPVTVTNDSRFCNCPRRWKWPPQALIDSLEYNWPIIPGSFVTHQDCYESYMQFSYAHREHQDPVCFRAAIFTAILGFWCKRYEFVYNVNLLSKANREAMFLTKINYNSARWYRCLEAMCATYFIIGPHHSLVNEFGATRYGVISRALKNQRLVLNTVVPQEEVMAPGYVEDYGPSSQRPFKQMDEKSKRQKR